MSVAAPVDVVDIGDLPRPDVVEQGTAAVYNYRFGHSMAACSCGWSGRCRYLKAAALQDARMRAIHDKCAIAVPLVTPFSKA